MKSKILKLFGFSLLLAGVALYIAPLFFPLPENLETGAPEGVVFVDEDGTVIRRMLDGDLRAEAPATFEEFPPVLIEATLAAEDSRFYQHNGIDILGTLRSVRDALNHGRFTSGASTISQQTIKIYSPPRRRTFRTKLIETMTARKLEMFFSKEEIMTAYLNRLPYGNQFTGARAATRGYFNKPLSDLSAAEAALLAGLPNKPSRLNPFRNLKGAEQRQKLQLAPLGWPTASCDVFTPGPPADQSQRDTQDGRSGHELTEAEVKQWVADGLANFKVPTYVEVQRDKLPRNASGKLLKNVLRGEGVVSFEETM